MIRRILLGALGVLTSIGLLPVTFAEEASGRYLEEIVVTGTKRETGQQETPLAVSTLTSQDIANTFVNDVRAVA
ncbi:MAG: hypothetical protein GWM88_03920, partial [Pseudomonadales bacterium]|nr:hypothetical protein [Pseudomonadales bacterium]NIX07210.1 hypothetical protein [Pseudomonadales bacterium]